MLPVVHVTMVNRAVYVTYCPYYHGYQGCLCYLLSMLPGLSMLPIVHVTRAVYVARQVGEEGTELLLKLLATELVVRVFQAIGGHQVCASCALTRL